MANEYETVEKSCPRRDCDETVETYPELIDLAIDFHLADHGALESQPGWPRGVA